MKRIDGSWENAPVVLFRCDLDGNLSYLNVYGKRILGLPKEGMRIQQAMDAPGKDQFSRLLKSMAKGRRTAAAEIPCMTKNGNMLPFLVQCSFDKRKNAVLGVAVDISERKKMESTLMKHEKTLEEAQRVANIGNWEWDLADNTLEWSTQIYKIFGLKKKHFKSKYETFLNLVHPDDKAIVTAAVNDALEKKRPYCIDHRIILPNGGIRMIHEQAEVTFDDQGKPVRMLGIAQDITERKKTEDELKSSTEKITELNRFTKGIIDSITDELIVIDPVTRGIVFANKQVLKRTGLSMEGLKTKRCFELYNHEEKQCDVCTMHDTLEKGSKTEAEKLFLDKKTNSVLHVGVAMHPVFDESGKIVQIVHYAKDITERKLYEQKLSDLNNMLLKLHNSSYALQKTFDLDKILEIAIKTFESLGFDTVRMYFYENGFLCGMKSNHIEDDVFSQVRFRVTEKTVKASKCINTKKPVVEITSARTSIAKILDKKAGMQSASLPLISENKCIGMISFDNRHSRRRINENDLMHLMTIANQIAGAIEGARLYEQSKKQVSSLSALYDIASAISGTLDLEKIMSMVVIRVVKLLKADRCTILLLDKTGRWLDRQALFDMKKTVDAPLRIPVKGTIAHDAIKENRIVYIKDIAKKRKYIYKDIHVQDGLVSLMSIPLSLENIPIGVVNIYTRIERKFADDELSLLNSLASNLSLVIENSKLYQRIIKDKENFSSLLQISQVIHKVRTVDKLVYDALNHSIALTGAEFGFVMLKHGEQFEVQCSSGFGGCSSSQISLAVGEGIPGWVAKHAKPLVIGNVLKDKRYIKISEDVLSAAAIPLVKKGAVIGVLYLESKKRDNFRFFAKSLVILTNLFATAMENIRLYEEVLNFNKSLEQKINDATKELREKNVQLRKMDQMKSDFVSNVSHELRTPLTSISGYTKLLHRLKLGQLNEKQLQALDIINKESDRLTRLINDVLDLAKLEAGKLAIAYETVDLNIIVAETVDMLSSIAGEKGISLSMKKSEKKAMIEAGGDLIKQVLINLLNNAIKFTNNCGMVEVMVSLKKDHAEVKVADTGKGIAPEALSKLFNKFYQVDSSMTREQGGTGLGLVIVKHILDLHKGSIMVESELDKGSTFTFTLPRKQEHSE